MPRKLPNTPVDVWRTTPETLDLAENAKRFGWWDFPLESAATDSAEMDGIDRAYWFYKSARPITRTSRDVSDALFLNDKSIVELPTAFRKQQTATLSALGDLIQARGLEHSKDLLFESIEAAVFNADISFANYESVVADDHVVSEAIGDGRSSMMCCSSAQYSALTEHQGRRFTILNLANNHSLDLGVQGLRTTQELCRANGIIEIGAPRCAEEYGRGTVFTKRGIRFGFVSVTFGLNGRPLPDGEHYCVHASPLMSKRVVADLELLKSQIRSCKHQNADVIIASIHWGFEFEFFPRRKQIELAHALVEEGADIILGHHPHVVQPIEYYRTTRDPNRVAVIAYSLGSLTWDWYTAPHLILSLMLNFQFAKGDTSAGSRTYIESVTATPLFRNIFYRGDNKVMRIEQLRDHLDAKNADFGHLEQMQQYVDLISGRGAPV
ncbi:MULTISPECIES: CapA family protein [Bradyrhizobium]|uniref:CapA family protein n=1 Tax=Bradyrhizobium zhengyangense TaxID=2911009 RepID=A0A9X1UFE9_9BRAD|nr:MULTISPECIES: CapA family protein [Bradyrhizobium]MCG2632953.1 CapA family protein [Bradyrhizobium zhengyangense]MCG2645683.1 CapA family protein [Bradyrhizobium zhengyangense]MCG2673155.1 CapA family protein [Bradyrhizobium zhengyangense]MDN4988240.1 CapA family protein [Bradyrhizobium sp. WYCCWR 13022]MDN5006306.1 CapA family protein [Bradyrhizobium sp. WYCCWR 12677]